MDEEPDELNGTLFSNVTIGARRDAARYTANTCLIGARTS